MKNFGEHAIVAFIVIAIMEEFFGLWPMVIIIVLSLACSIWFTVRPALRESLGEVGTDHDAEVCYRLLGVSPTASWEEIERAFRKKAKVHHPDHNGDEDVMRALNEARALLKKLRGA